MNPHRCRRLDCPCRPLPWIALCALCVGGALGYVPGDSCEETTAEEFDRPEDRRAAYPDGEPEAAL